MAWGFCSTVHARASARIRRPSASVLITSIVLPSRLSMTSPGLLARPFMRFSDDGTTPSTLTGRSAFAIAIIAPTTAAPPDMSYFMSSMPFRRLERDPARVEREPLANERHWGLTLGAAVVTQDDQPRLFVGTLGHGQQRVHPLLEQSIRTPGLEPEPHPVPPSPPPPLRAAKGSSGSPGGPGDDARGSPSFGGRLAETHGGLGRSGSDFGRPNGSESNFGKVALRIGSLELPKHPGAQNQPLGHRTHELLIPTRFRRTHEDEPGTAQALGDSNGAAREHPGIFGCKGRGVADP